jgi:hypothetical protein
MNLKLSMEEDSQWKMFINMKGYKNRMVSQRKNSYYHGRLPEWNGVEWYHKGSNHKMKNIQG